MFNFLLADANLDNASSAFSTMMKTIWPWLVGIFVGLIALWSLYVGIRLIVAKSQEQQKEAKGLIKNFIIGIVVIFVLAVVVTALVYFLKDWSQDATDQMSGVFRRIPAIPQF